MQLRGNSRYEPGYEEAPCFEAAETILTEIEAANVWIDALEQSLSAALADDAGAAPANAIGEAERGLAQVDAFWMSSRAVWTRSSVSPS